MRIGFGYDVHKLVENRPLIIGGIQIPFEYGLLGHSDADVLIHAIMDSIFGALALQDIGFHFPDTDMRYKDIDSKELLKKTRSIMENHGYRIGNIDTTIAAQKPKLSPYIQEMREKISQVLNINTNQISIKATTTEELGFEGRKEGISAYAICLLEPKGG
ncbi:MAG: 2-C-methyl-D-erythritol 2,4-cyclodiphosphate synthase [Tissierellia bacterium]|nr:2-C-methyl-D-erythritol 2,4-cyclodiphosphate synthase [Tissierellia bacterium]